MKKIALALASVLAVVAAFECVPADTRPVPGSLTMTVSPSPAVSNGVVTADGWTIAFDRVLIAIGNEGLSDPCAVYGEANYDRILDITHDGGQHLGIVHGLGQCDVDFRVTAPSSDALLGEGVTEEDKTRLRTPGGDYYIPLGGISTEIAFTATRGDVKKRFYFPFRARIRYQRCALDQDSGIPSVDLRSHVDLTYNVRIEAEAVLRDDLDAGAALRFDPFAAADKDNDGLITVEELRGIPIEQVRDSGAFEAGTYEVDDAGLVQRGRPIVIATLGDYVYEILAPTLARFRDTGTCTASVRNRPAN